LKRIYLDNLARNCAELSRATVEYWQYVPLARLVAESRAPSTNLLRTVHKGEDKHLMEYLLLKCFLLMHYVMVTVPCPIVQEYTDK